jgi:hypothetical protein
MFYYAGSYLRTILTGGEKITARKTKLRAARVSIDKRSTARYCEIFRENGKA